MQSYLWISWLIGRCMLVCSLIALNQAYIGLCIMFFFLIFQVQKGSPALNAGLEPFFDFILSIGHTRLVSSRFKTLSLYIINSYNFASFLMTWARLTSHFKLFHLCDLA